MSPEDKQKLTDTIALMLGKAAISPVRHDALVELCGMLWDAANDINDIKNALEKAPTDPATSSCWRT